MSSAGPVGQETLYDAYKRLEREIFKELDPSNRLGPCRIAKSKTTAEQLFKNITRKARTEVAHKLGKAIGLRQEWGKRYTFAPDSMKKGHRQYICFLTGIKNMLCSDQVGALDVNAHRPGDNELENAPAEDVVGTVEEAININLTPEQLDFLAFLGSVLALTQEAAALWHDVGNGKLRIWTATIMTDVLLQEAMSLIMTKKLLDEENLDSQSPKIWATSAKDGDNNMSQPQLAQDWVDALNETSNADHLWHKLKMLLPDIWPCIQTFLVPLYAIRDMGYTPTAIHQPMVVRMLAQGLTSLSTNNPTSLAQVPFTTLVATHFCVQIASKDSNSSLLKNEKKELIIDLVDLNAARKAACTNLNEDLALLPRLINQNALDEERVTFFREAATWLKKWAQVCIEPVSLGAIHTFARALWVQWYVRIVGSNSVPLQTFLYLCEEHRLWDQSTTLSSTPDSGEYERLIGALLQDVRVAPQLLMDGRPKTISDCNHALQSWCHLPVLKLHAQEHIEVRDPTLTQQRLKIMENSNHVRTSRSLYEDIRKNDFRMTKAIQARLAVTDSNNISTALKRYLSWEMSPPSCLDLEAALFRAVEGKPPWESLKLAAMLNVLRRTPDWLKAIQSVIVSGLTRLCKLHASLQSSTGVLKFGEPLETAVLKAVLNKAERKGSLKTAFVNIVQPIAGWQDEFADELLNITTPQWNAISTRFKIEPLSRSWQVKSLACIDYLITHECRSDRRKVVKDLLTDFLTNARSTLEEAYGNKPS